MGICILAVRRFQRDQCVPTEGRQVQYDAVVTLLKGYGRAVGAQGCSTVGHHQGLFAKTRNVTADIL